MRFGLLINFKIPTIVGIITFISRINTTSDSFNQGKIIIFTILLSMRVEISCSAKVSMKKSIFTSRPGLQEDFKKWEHQRNN